MGRYEMIKNSLPNADKTKKLYPRMVTEGQVGTDELVKLISASSTFTEGDIRGMIEALSCRIALEMGLGHTVKVDGIGTFSALLELKDNRVEEQKNGHNRNALSIKLKGIGFRADSKLVHRTADHFTPQRSLTKFNYSSDKFSLEERRALALKRFEKYPVMLLQDYLEITGLQHSTGWRELETWMKENGCPIQRCGRGNHTWYELKSKD